MEVQGGCVDERVGPELRIYHTFGWPAGGKTMDVGTIDAFNHQRGCKRRTGIQTSHDSVISTIHPQRFNPQSPLIPITA
jgi:hypothetical protein